MKIIHIITGLSTGGAEHALYNLLKGGLSDRSDTYIVSLGDEGTLGPKIASLGIPVTPLNMHNRRLPLMSLIKLMKIIRKFQPDLIQGWMYHGNLMGFFSRIVAVGRPVLVWNIRHSLSDLNQEKVLTRQVIRINRLFSSRPDLILYNSHRSLKQHEDFVFSKVNSKVISNGIDTRLFSFSSLDRKNIRSMLDIPENARVIGHMARFHPMKDHSTFIKVAESLAYRYQDLYFLLSGEGVVSDNKKLNHLISPHLRHRFYLLGERNDVNKLMSAIDIFCLSSAWGEGFPNVLGEAMATSVPCVATDIGDSALIIDNTGVIIPPSDLAALEKGLNSLLKISSEERFLLGAEAMDRIKTNYQLSKIVDIYKLLYYKLTHKS
jgi:glycosyltransferase involved in cell wall biosynthesis